MHNLAVRMASVFVLYGESAEEDIDIYAYACEAVLALLVNILVCLVIAFLFGRVMEGLVFISGFALLRRYTGGYHAKSHFACIMIFSIVVVCAMLLLNVVDRLQMVGIVMMVIATVSLVGILLIGTIQDVNKPSGYEFDKLLKRKSRLVAFTLWGLCGIGYYLLDTQVGLMLSLAMMAVFYSMGWVVMSCKINFFRGV